MLKKLKKLTLALTLASAAFLPAAADEVVVDGIKYITDASTHTASVTYHIASDSGSTSDNADYYVGNITIPETIIVEDETYTVTSIGERAFRTCDKLTGVTLPNTITSIGSCGFEHCNALTEVILSPSVKTLGDLSFANCSSSLHLTLTDVTRIDYNALKNTTGAFLKFLSNTPPSLYNSYCLGQGNIFIVPDDAKTAYASAFSSVYGLLFAESEMPGNTDETKTDYTVATTPLENQSGLQKALIIDNGFDVLPCVKSLKVIGTINRIDFAVIKQMTNLIQLDLSEVTVDGNAISANAFQNLSKLESITLPAAVTAIDNYAFSGCAALQSIGDLPNVKTIGNNAFTGCSSLQTIGDMPSLTTIGVRAFSSTISYGVNSCIALKSIGDMPALTTINEYAFSGCGALQSIGELSKLATIGNYAFQNCSSLETVSNLPELASIGGSAFQGCSVLQSIGEMPKLTTINQSAFSGCVALQSIGNMPALTTIMNNAFSGCTALQSIGDMSALTRISHHAFENCSSLETLRDLPLLAFIGSDAFMNCSSLETVNDMPLLAIIDGNAFSGCTSLHTIGDLPSLTTIGDGAFSSDDMYTRVPACTALQSIGDMPALTTIKDNAFYGCTALRSIGIMSALTTIGTQAFRGCSSLQTIGDLPSLTTIGNNTFTDCSALHSIGDMPALTKIQIYAFRNCSSLETLSNLPLLATIDSNAFSGCTSLQTIGDLPSLTTIGDGAFSSDMYTSLPACTALKSIGNMPTLTTIDANAFFGCGALQSIGGMPALTTIGGGAFKNTGIQDLALPETLTNVATSAFSYPTVVHFAGATPPTFTGESTTSSGVTTETKSIATTICVGAGSVEAYREALPDMAASYIIVEGLTDYDVTVSALENDSDVLNKVNEEFDRDMALNVVNLKVSGTINSYDIIVFRNKMLNLKTLDLRDATIVGSSYEYYSGQHTVDNVVGTNMFTSLKLTEIKLPKTALSIAQSAANDCKFLTLVTLPDSLHTIGAHAFLGCSRISEITFPKCLKTIGYRAFSECSGLSAMELSEGLTTIGFGAFKQCTSLKSVTLPQSLVGIGGSPSYTEGLFSGCSSLKEIVLPPAITSIPEGCFYNCSSLQSVSMPPTLSSIGQRAFYGCNALKEVRIPAGISSIGNNAIPSTVRDVYTYTIQPTSITQETFGSDTYLNATLHVPETSEKLYYWDTQWSQFQTIENFNEPYSYFYLADKDLVENPDTPRIEGETDEETGDKKNPDADLGKDSGLIVDGDESQNLGNVELEHDGTGTGATIIGGDSNTSESGGNVNVDMLNIKIPVLAKKWYFFAFPFDIAMTDIKFEGQMVWRYYDGEWRAMHGSGSWKDVTADKLERGKGYIFQGSKAGTLTLSIPKVSFDAKNWIQELKQYVADAAQDASWNFIGNPFQSFYELADLGFDGPITCWNPNNNTYDAYSPLDDDLAMHPFMAFFVQKPEGKETVDFFSQFRETKNQKDDPNHRAAARKRRAARMGGRRASERVLVNLSVSDGTNSDATRVVFNSRATDAYEPGVDASKFVSADAPQIYSLDSRNVRYAINERPAGDGTVRLGFYAPAAGTFTIECTRTDCSATLYDAETGKTVTLAAGDVYEFTAKKGYDDGRFVLNAKGADVTSIEEVEAADCAESDFYGINGVRADGSRKGVMIEVKGNEAKKVIRK